MVGKSQNNQRHVLWHLPCPFSPLRHRVKSLWFTFSQLASTPCHSTVNLTSQSLRRATLKQTSPPVIIAIPDAFCTWTLQLHVQKTLMASLATQGFWCLYQMCAKETQLQYYPTCIMLLGKRTAAVICGMLLSLHSEELRKTYCNLTGAGGWSDG